MKYKLLKEGVKDLDTGATIPFCEGNRHFTEYMLWCADGNSPEPRYTEEELVAKAAREEHTQLLEDIRHIDRSLLKLIIRLYQALAGKGVINKADVGDAYINGALALRDKLSIVEANE